MKLGIMQPYFFPYLGYWQLISAVDKYVVYDDVAFIKGGWISRNNILLGGNKHLITLPLENASSFRNINEIEITKNEKAVLKVIKALNAAYCKAPYYNDVMPMLEALITQNRTIAQLNFNAILAINKYLNVNTEILLSSDIKKSNELKGQEKVIHINKLLGADTYINAIGGQQLYSVDTFHKENIKLQFLKMDEDIQYKQFNNEFVSNLSIIDVLMFNNVSDVQSFLKKYSLV